MSTEYKGVEIKYYSTQRPINKIELDILRYNLPSDFYTEYKQMSHRGERQVYLVKVDYNKKKVIVGYKE